MNQGRRDFLKGTGAGLLTLKVGGAILHLTPAEARARNIGLQVLGERQANLLEALGEVLVPGARKYGIAHFVDFQLSGTVREAKLGIRYLGLDMSYTEFYLEGLDALEAQGQSLFGHSFDKIAASDQAALVRRLMADKLPGWEGPPPAKFYYAVKSDAVDVVYGTREGIERLGIPFMPHIIPPTDWGQVS